LLFGGRAIVRENLVQQGVIEIRAPCRRRSRAKR
jgi:hypothetical protein